MQQDRININEIFASFLRWDCERAFTATNTSRFNRYLSPHSFAWINAASMKFDKSWDWLMPVWYQFRDFKFDEQYALKLERNVETALNIHKYYVARLAQDIAYGSIDEFYTNLHTAISWVVNQKK